MKLRVVLLIFRTGLTPKLWYEAQLWAISEHGLSLFAAAVLAIRPIFAYVSTKLAPLRSKTVGLTSSGSGASSRGREGSGGGGGESRSRKIVGWWVQPFKPLMFTVTAGRSRGGSRGSRGGEEGGRSRDESVSIVGNGNGNGSGGAAGGEGWEDVELGGFWKEPEGPKVRVGTVNLA